MWGERLRDFQLTYSYTGRYLSGYLCHFFRDITISSTVLKCLKKIYACLRQAYGGCGGQFWALYISAIARADHQQLKSLANNLTVLHWHTGRLGRRGRTWSYRKSYLEQSLYRVSRRWAYSLGITISNCKISNVCLRNKTNKMPLKEEGRCLSQSFTIKNGGSH